MLARIIVVLGALGLAWPAAAGGAGATAPAAPPAAQPTPAAASAYADRLIAADPQPALWQNVTGSDTTPSIRYVRNGMVCRFTGSHADRLEVFPLSSAAAAGDDVGCNTALSARGFLITLYATRYRVGDFQAHFQGAVAEMRQRYGAMTPWTGTASSVAMPQGSQTARFVVNNEGHQEYSRVSMTEVRGWTIMIRFSAPTANGEAADEFASRMFAAAVNDIAGAR